MEGIADVVICIDFGITATGVAYTIYPFENVIEMDWIEEAGEARSYRAATKIPTVLEYESYGTPRSGKVRSWGFQAAQNSESLVGRENLKVVEWFKPYLNANYLNAACQSSASFFPKSDAEVRRWYIDYLQQLYPKVQAEIVGKLKNRPWDTLHIEFRFTWPTTWASADIESFRSCISRAGYGSGGKRHRVNLMLSEAQAAALDVAGRKLKDIKDGDTVMVCDVGGGTTDIAVVKASTDIDGRIRFDLDRSYAGSAVGTTDIDAAFQLFVQRRLSFVPLLHLDKIAVARHMRESRDWSQIKHGLDESQSYSIAVPGAVPDNDDAGITHRFMTITEDDLRDIYHEPLAKVERIILDAVQAYRQPLATSGGYFYINTARRAFKNINLHSGPYLSHCSAIKIEIASEPELAVAKGGCIPDPCRLALNSIGLVCGDRLYEQAGLSKIAWVDRESIARSGTQVAVLPMAGAVGVEAFTFSFKHPPKALYSYLTLVVLSIPLRDQVEGTDRPLCQLRVERRHLKRSWRQSKVLLHLNWRVSGYSVSLGLGVRKSLIPFEMRQLDSTSQVIVPEGTLSISDGQWCQEANLLDS